MKKLLTQKRLSNILMIFIVLSIFLDFHVFYSPIATLIRCIIISVLFLIVLILYNKPKDIKKLFIYFFIIVIYITSEIFPNTILFFFPKNAIITFIGICKTIINNA